MHIEKVRKILLGEVIGLLSVSLIIVVLFETNLVLSGGMIGKERESYLVVMQFVMQLLTLTVVPFALYMFRFSFVKKQLSASPLRAITALLVWGSFRIGLLCFPMVLNTLFYYLFGFEVSFFYLALILFLSIIFIFPHKKRCENECFLMDKKENK